MKGAHLWKRILNEGLMIPPDLLPTEGKDGYVEHVVNRILTIPIVVDSVVQPLGEYNYDWSKYIGLAIPFPNFWVEGAITDKGFWGTKVTSVPIDEAAPSQVRDIVGGRGWLIQLFACMAIFGDRPWAFGRVTVYINQEGDLVDAKNGNLHFRKSISQWGKFEGGIELPGGYDPLRDVAHQTVQTVFDVLRLLSCKNVSLKPNDNDPKQVRRAIKRHGGNADSYRYHTLVVRPAGAKHDSPGIDIGVMPRHVARGHFAEYGPEFGKGLLFGKYAGRFFIPPCLKGKKENGIVEKDYVVPDDPR